MTTSGQIRIGAQRQSYAGRWMGRRKFIKLIGGSAISWPLASYALQPKRLLKHIGVLAAFGPCPFRPDNPVVRALAELGWIEEQNFVFDCVSSVDRGDQVPALARELVSRRPDVLIAGPWIHVIALKQQTTTIPIVMVTGLEPERLGLVASLARPEGNVTGVAWFYLLPKQMELLKEIVPNLRRVALVAGGGGATELPPETLKILREYQTIAANKLGFAWQVFQPPAANDYEEIFARLAAEHFDAAYITGTPLNLQNQTRICQLALRYRILTVSESSLWAKNGLLLTYGQDYLWSIARAMGYVDKILRGAKPSDLPVEQATKLLLTINLKTAKELGVSVPPSLIARADELIE
jgi:putative ABC transport system substrate-binding protein